MLRQRRRNRGAVLALVCALALVLIVFGIGIFTLIKVLGGMRELQHATDSGNLNVAKQAFKSPSVPLANGLEQNNFGGLVDEDGRIGLRNYNRLVGQTLLVALNAQAEGTTQSRDNALALAQALEIGPSSIGGRLKQSLSDTTNTSDFFDFLARANMLRLLNGELPGARSASFETAYLKAGESTNVFLDPSILPAGVNAPGTTFSAGRADATGFNYLSGYQTITVPGICTVAGVPVLPGQKPHLVSNTLFDENRDRPIDGYDLPPNSFKSAGMARERASNDFLNAVSCAIVGALDHKFTASIPRGYLVITNPAGMMDATPPPSPNTILNNELFSGIFVANNGAFSLDAGLIQAWAAYNTADPPTGQPPPTEGLFGDPYGIRSLGGDGFPSMCNYLSLDGPGANSACQNLEAAFRDAYGSQDTAPPTPSELTATEQMRANVWGLFPQGGPLTFPDGFTGIRIFDRNSPQPVAEGSPPVFTQAGTAAQILSQVGNGTGSELTVLNQIRQRMREIKPEATIAEVDSVLASRPIALGETLYVYMTGNTLQLTNAPPPWLVAGTAPDGLPLNISSTFQTIGLSVNPPGDLGFSNVVFEFMPNPSTMAIGEEEAIFTPSSGFNNLLGTLEFRSRIIPGSDPFNGGDGGGGN